MADERQRKTLSQLAGEAQGEPKSFGDKPADECPYCGCAMFANGTEERRTRIERYRKCRNPSCGKTFFTTQAPEKIVREVEPHRDNFPSVGKSELKIRRESA